MSKPSPSESLGRLVGASLGENVAGKLSFQIGGQGGLPPWAASPSGGDRGMLKSQLQSVYNFPKNNSGTILDRPSAK
jgi:hypothetical protein